MKINKYLGAMLFASCALVGCSDDTGIEGDMPKANVGDYITFSGYVGFDNADNNAKTRTIYGDEGTFDGTQGTEIRWYEGDKVAIYCAEALEGKLAHYSVVDYMSASAYDTTYVNDNGGGNGTLENKDYTRLQPTGVTPGLKWGSEDGVHTFYAVYPSPAMFDAQSQVATNFSLNGSTLTGYLPSYQAPSTYDEPIKYEKYGDSALHVIRPAMQYAYMVAKDETTAERPYTDLTFNPLVTAVEFTVTNDCYIETTETVGEILTSQTPTPIPNIQQITISTTDGTPIAGKFTTTDLGGNGMTTSISDADAVTSITVPTLGKDKRPITLQPYESIRFTVFMLPNKNGKDVDLTNLNISVLTGIANKTATLSLSDGGVIVQAKKKNFLSGIKLKWDVNYVDINWMSQLPGDVKIGDLSIPGAGGAGSENMAEGRRQQTLSIEKLWNIGVRSFEMFTDNYSDMGNSYLICNGTQSTTTLNTAISYIKSKLEENPREMAVVTIGYQPITTRSSAGWQKNFNSYWSGNVNNWEVETSVKNDAGENIVCKAAKFHPTMTLDEARGKLFLLYRPTGIGRDAWWYSLASDGNTAETDPDACGYPDNAVAIMGWGPTADFWYSRGYTRLDRPYYISTTGNFSDALTSTPTTGGTNYTYPSFVGMYSDTDGSMALESSGSAETQSQNSTEHECDWVENLTWVNPTATSEHKFMYRVMDRGTTWAPILGISTDATVPGADAGFTRFVNYDELRAYVQDWRRVSKGFRYPEGTSVEEEKTYKVALSVTENSDNISSLTVNSVTINRESIETKNSDGYYELDLGTTLPTSDFYIVVDVTGTYISKGGNTYTDYFEYTYEVDPAELTYTNNLYTFVATATYKSKELTVDGSITGPTDYSSDDSSSSSSTYYYYWPDSREEKKNDVYQALIKATTATDNDKTIYINSLCGFFIDEAYPMSYIPDPMIMSFIPTTSGTSTNYAFGDIKYGNTEVGGGYADYFTYEAAEGDAYDMYGGTEGDIASFATWMNDFFYNKLLEIGANNLQGSTGLILCDRISDDPNTNPAGYYINQIIIANNFKQHGTNASVGSNTNTGSGSNDESDDTEAGAAPRNGQLIWK